MRSVTEEKTSNFRESANLVLRLKKLVNDGVVPKGSEVFIVTDNAVFESIYFKGSSKSHFLHEMIVELKKLEMENTLIVHVFWISRLVSMVYRVEIYSQALWQGMVY